VIAGGLFAFALAAAASAETLPDPTRPPASVLAPPADAAAIPGLDGALVLQSVLIAPDRRSAVISGQSMKVGDTVGGFRLVRVAAGEVTLEGLEGSRTLSLFPDVHKHRVTTATDPAPRGARPRHKGRN